MLATVEMQTQTQTQTQTPVLDRHDRKALAVLKKVDALRAKLKEAERELSQEVIGFGKRRGYVTGCYREFHMRTDLRQKGVIDG